MEDVIEAVAEAAGRQETVALASLVASTGSIPMSERAKMMVSADGSAVGTIGGGCLEAEILARGREVVAARRAHLTRYTMTEEQAGADGLNCGGTVRIFTEPVSGPSAAAYLDLAEARRRRLPCAMATLLGTGQGAPDKALYGDGAMAERPFADPALDGAARAHVTQVLASERPVVVEVAGAGEIFVEPFVPSPVLYVFGGGHVGGHIARLARAVGFRTVVIDDRPAFASRQRHPEVDDCLVLPMDSALSQLPVDGRTYIVAATRGHQHDEVVVEQAIRTPARYIGMLGSERKKLILWERIAGRGGDRQRLEQVYAPVGHNIGADTPEEIGVSVVSELIAVRRGPRRPWRTKRSGTGPAVAGGA